jgi:hypothetical protein
MIRCTVCISNFLDFQDFADKIDLPLRSSVPGFSCSGPCSRPVVFAIVYSILYCTFHLLYSSPSVIVSSGAVEYFYNTWYIKLAKTVEDSQRRKCAQQLVRIALNCLIRCIYCMSR